MQQIIWRLKLENTCYIQAMLITVFIALKAFHWSSSVLQINTINQRLYNQKAFSKLWKMNQSIHNIYK